MNATAYLRHLKHDGGTLASIAREQPSTRVPTCPEWTLADLLAHVGSAHHWAEETIRTRATEFCPFSKPPKDFGAVCAWYDHGLNDLVQTLAAVDPDQPVWNWQVMGLGPARFWQRRMAHETAVHRWDAESSLGVATPVPTDLAVDGIDEYLGIVSFSLSMKPNEALAGTLGLEATDAPLAYTLTLAPTQVIRQKRHDDPDAVVRGTSSDLLLWLVGRRTNDGEAIIVEGERSVIDGWSTVRF